MWVSKFDVDDVKPGLVVHVQGAVLIVLTVNLSPLPSLLSKSVRGFLRLLECSGGLKGRLQGKLQGKLQRRFQGGL